MPRVCRAEAPDLGVEAAGSAHLWGGWREGERVRGWREGEGPGRGERGRGGLRHCVERARALPGGRHKDRRRPLKEEGGGDGRGSVGLGRGRPPRAPLSRSLSLLPRRAPPLSASSYPPMPPPTGRPPSPGLHGCRAQGVDRPLHATGGADRAREAPPGARRWPRVLFTPRSRGRQASSSHNHTLITTYLRSAAADTEPRPAGTGAMVGRGEGMRPAGTGARRADDEPTHRPPDARWKAAMRVRAALPEKASVWESERSAWERGGAEEGSGRGRRTFALSHSSFAAPRPPRRAAQPSSSLHMSRPHPLADRLRAGAHAALGRHAYGAAAFFAEQLAALPGEEKKRRAARRAPGPHAPSRAPPAWVAAIQLHERGAGKRSRAVPGGGALALSKQEGGASAARAFRNPLLSPPLHQPRPPPTPASSPTPTSSAARPGGPWRPSPPRAALHPQTPPSSI